MFNSCSSTTAPDLVPAYRHRLNLSVMKRAKHRASACCRWPGLLAEHVFRSCHNGVLSRSAADGDAISRSNAHALSGGISLRIRCWCMGACRKRKHEERNEVAHSWQLRLFDPTKLIHSVRRVETSIIILAANLGKTVNRTNGQRHPPLIAG